MNRMKSLHLWLLAGLLPMAIAGSIHAEQSFAEKLGVAGLEYQHRLDTATRELEQTREQIAREQEPLSASVLEYENRLAELETKLAGVRKFAAQAADTKRLRLEEAAGAERTLRYLETLGKDNLKILQSALLPGETMGKPEQLAQLVTRLEASPSAEAKAGIDTVAALDVLEILLERTRRSLGGHTLSGKVLLATDNRVAPATLVYVGPEGFFLTTDSTLAGVLRTRDSAPYPIAHPVQTWSPDVAGPLPTGLDTQVPLDASGGRALLLLQARGSIMDHLRKGGMVGALILGLGLLAVGIAIVKAASLRGLVVDSRQVFQVMLERVAKGPKDGAEDTLAGLTPVTREILDTGLRHWRKPAQVLEERLYGVMLQSRMQNERLLPMLAVIITAAPLLGLLGTVTGMVKTFTLITIHGTGNAAKLSSGISEALVTTELGLMVAIPTLLVHGYFSMRVKRNLNLLESHAHEIATAAAEAGSARAPGSGETGT